MAKRIPDYVRQRHEHKAREYFASVEYLKSLREEANSGVLRRGRTIGGQAAMSVPKISVSILFKRLDQLQAERDLIADGAAYSGCPNTDKVNCPDSHCCMGHGDDREAFETRKQCWLEWAEKEAARK